MMIQSLSVNSSSDSLALIRKSSPNTSIFHRTNYFDEPFTSLLASSSSAIKSTISLPPSPPPPSSISSAVVERTSKSDEILSGTIRSNQTRSIAENDHNVDDIDDDENDDDDVERDKIDNDFEHNDDDGVWNPHLDSFQPIRISNQRYSSGLNSFDGFKSPSSSSSSPPQSSSSLFSSAIVVRNQTRRFWPKITKLSSSSLRESKTNKKIEPESNRDKYENNNNESSVKMRSADDDDDDAVTPPTNNHFSLKYSNVRMTSTPSPPISLSSPSPLIPMATSTPIPPPSSSFLRLMTTNETIHQRRSDSNRIDSFDLSPLFASMTSSSLSSSKNQPHIKSHNIHNHLNFIDDNDDSGAEEDPNDLDDEHLGGDLDDYSREESRENHGIRSKSNERRKVSSNGHNSYNTTVPSDSVDETLTTGSSHNYFITDQNDFSTVRYSNPHQSSDRIRSPSASFLSDNQDDDLYFVHHHHRHQPIPYPAFYLNSEPPQTASVSTPSSLSLSTSSSSSPSPLSASLPSPSRSPPSLSSKVPSLTMDRINLIPSSSHQDTIQHQSLRQAETKGSTTPPTTPYRPERKRSKSKKSKKLQIVYIKVCGFFLLKFFISRKKFNLKNRS